MARRAPSPKFNQEHRTPQETKLILAPYNQNNNYPKEVQSRNKTTPHAPFMVFYDYKTPCK